MGVDMEVRDKVVVGMGLNIDKTDVKYKNFKAGDKTKIDTFGGFIYGFVGFDNSVFVKGNVSFGSSKAKNTEARLFSDGTKATASGKYDIVSYGVGASLGYAYNLNSFIVTPEFGLDYNKFNQSAYTETGASYQNPLTGQLSNQNLTVSKKSSDKLDGVLGVRADFVTPVNGMDIIPGIGMDVRHNLLDKKQKVTFKLEGLNPMSKTAKTTRTYVSGDVGVRLQADNGLSGGVNYRFTGASKYQLHQVTLNVRADF